MPSLQPLPAAAGNPERLHSAGNVLNHDGRRNDEARDDYVRFLFAEKGLLLDVESKPEIAVSQVFRGKTARHIDIRHNGRFYKHDTHFDVASTGEVRGDCSPADGEAGAFRAAVSTHYDILYSLSSAYGSHRITGCNESVSGSRPAFISSGSITAAGESLPQITGKRTSNTIRKHQPINDAVFLTVRDPGRQTHLTIDPLDIDACGEDIHHDDRFRQRGIVFGHCSTSIQESEACPVGTTTLLAAREADESAALISLPLESTPSRSGGRLGAEPPPAPSHQFTMVSA